MAPRIGLIDYGMGNLLSVQLAFKRLDLSIKLVRTPSELENLDALILPGVGSFDPAMEHLESTNLIPNLKKWAKEGKPILGICLGLQLLFESSEEGSIPGLGLLKGHVQKLPINQKERIPHMGWAQLQLQKTSPLLDQKDSSSWMYFVHSYAAIPKEELDLAATASFGKTRVTAIVWKGRLGACQFHPEKSAKSGQKMLLRWLEWLKNGAEAIN